MIMACHRSSVLLFSLLSITCYGVSALAAEIQIGADARLSSSAYLRTEAAVSITSSEAVSVSPNGDLAPAKRMLTENAHQKRSATKADCDVASITQPTVPPTPDASGDVSSYFWRVRIETPCRESRADSDRNITEWELSTLSFYTDTCENTNGSALRMFSSRTSGKTGPGSGTLDNKEMAFDGDPSTYWLGDADDNDQVWLAARFSTPQVVKCVKFTQCDCVRSARVVALEYTDDDDNEEDWHPLAFTKTDDVNWGEPTMISVPAPAEPTGWFR